MLTTKSWITLCGTVLSTDTEFVEVNAVVLIEVMKASVLGNTPAINAIINVIITGIM